MIKESLTCPVTFRFMLLMVFGSRTALHLGILYISNKLVWFLHIWRKNLRACLLKRVILSLSCISFCAGWRNGEGGLIGPTHHYHRPLYTRAPSYHGAPMYLRLTLLIIKAIWIVPEPTQNRLVSLLQSILWTCALCLDLDI